MSMTFLDHIKVVEDHRVPGMTTYPLDEVLLTILAGLLCRMEDFDGLCHVAVPRARSIGTSGIVRPLRLQSATWSSPQREARGAFGLRGDGVGR